MKKNNQVEQDVGLRQKIADRIRYMRGDRTPEVMERDARSRGIDLSARYIRRLEAAGSSPTIEKLQGMCVLCGWSLGEFFAPWLPENNKAHKDQKLRVAVELALKQNPQRLAAFVKLLES